MPRVFLLSAVFLFLPAKAMACMPLPERFWEETPERVKSNFDGAKFVVVAKVVKVVVTPAEILPGEIEQATFRVERSFKGLLKPGSTFMVESGRTACARGVLDDTWRFSIPSKSQPRKPDYPERWLIYYTPPVSFRNEPLGLPFEIQVSPLSMPLSQARYDLDVLRRSSRQWAH
jgi:hypothetical protein